MAITTNIPQKKRYSKLLDPELGVINPIPKATRKPNIMAVKAGIFHLETLFFKTKALANISPKKKAHSGIG
jgi:hypothetical protein